MRKPGLWRCGLLRVIQWQNDPTATSAFKCSPLLNHLCALEDTNASFHTRAPHWGARGLQFHTVNYGPYDPFRSQAEGTAIRLPAEADRERMHVGSAWLWGLLNQESQWTTGMLRKCERLP